ncbi:MAG: hypothetical protein PHY04_02920 [Candidatus ainarchaeum sp.]|jgi:hypothetical protein|nr:hypothetical protein [Candidatus ainarchaeum sp.]MDD3086091.1 hypothetical protein [Candidatus ainarchaeum sp.]MDD4128662.1 hypothetical protein [Candidatus ainarchaeum sp.]MDD4467774.1 hypothetical protein [Candidatus ainarchaeum sp.]HPM85782.1 hypothetical protein [archaeon]
MTLKNIPLGKKCPKAHRLINKIGLRPQARNTTAFKVLKGKYARLKAERGVNFNSLKEAGYSIQMMLDLGMPIPEIIIGHLAKKGGIQNLVSEVTKLHNSNDHHYKKLNFKTLVSQGISLKRIYEAKAQIGLLLWEGFTKQELVEAGYEEKRVDSVIRFINERKSKKQ